MLQEILTYWPLVLINIFVIGLTLIIIYFHNSALWFDESINEWKYYEVYGYKYGEYIVKAPRYGYLKVSITGFYSPHQENSGFEVRESEYFDSYNQLPKEPIGTLQVYKKT